MEPTKPDTPDPAPAATLETTNPLKEMAKWVALRTPVVRRMVGPRYTYSLEPEQLALLVRAIDETQDVPGDIVEIGCALGKTTVFLNRHLDNIGSKKRYHCLDTFSGFTRKDLAFEAEERGKTRGALLGFGYNSEEIFQNNMARAGCSRVSTRAGDISEMDISDLTISLCLLDVDLYLPILNGLRKVYERLSPGGIIVVDDVLDNHRWDGAWQAYHEFVEEIGQQPELMGIKTGILRKK